MLIPWKGKGTPTQSFLHILIHVFSWRGLPCDLDYILVQYIPSCGYRQDDHIRPDNMVVPTDILIHPDNVIIRHDHIYYRFAQTNQYIVREVILTHPEEGIYCTSIVLGTWKKWLRDTSARKYMLALLSLFHCSSSFSTT